MYLRNLTLKGFKSFADTTTLDLEPGITVVVGPNGSGKSNVVDAVAWVLGAQGPRTLRSTKMDDVIFAGTVKRPALGRAEVSLTIDNTSGMLPIDFPEVTISRTLFRTGASEYAINQVPCRLLDIQELLSDSGVGRTQHVIVGQGQLEGVLEARPEERRAIIEEAAGVLKFRRRKEKAQRRLAATEGNLVRLSDLVREVRRQLRPLERQAEATRRHAGLAEELRALRLHLAGRQLSSLSARRAAAEEGRARLSSEERAVRSELRGLDDAVDAASAELPATGEGDGAEVLVRAERLTERARGLAAVLAERRRSAERDRSAALAQTVVAALESEGDRLRTELAALEEEVAALAPEGERLARAEAELADERSRLETGSEDGAGAAGPAAEARAALAAAATAVERGEAERARAGSRLAALEDRAERQSGEGDGLSRRVALAREGQARLAPLLAAASEAVGAAQTALEVTEEAARAAASEASAWSARAEALAAALDHSRARAGAQRLAGVEGVMGTLLELVEIDPGWEAAFEAAAGSALGAVVVAGGGAGARHCLDLLRATGPGSVLGLGVDRPSPPSPGRGEAVRAHVRAPDPEVGALLDALVGGAVCVGGRRPAAWEEALDVAVSSPGAVVVTLAGDRFAPDGWRVGEQATGATSAAVDEARARASDAAERARSADDRRRRAREDLERARRSEADVAREAQQHGAAMASAEDALSRVTSAVHDTRAEVEELRRQAAGLEETVGRDRRRVAELEAALPGLEADEQRSRVRREELRAWRSRVQERADAVAALRTDLEIRAGALSDRRSWLQRRLTEVDARLAEDRVERDRAEERRGELDARLAATAGLAALVGERLGWLDSALGDLRRQRLEQAERARAVAERIDGLRRQRQAAEQRLERLREQALRAGMEAQELALRAEAAVESLGRDLDAEPEAALAAVCPPLPEGVTASARARDLEREIRLLGPVNPLALEEVAALEERQRFLEGELDDVKSSRRQLSRVIRAIDAEIVDQFVAAFADVSENFARLFSVLFPGGEGQLELTDPADPLETGIRVRARPSGKNVRSVSLLSGGERSLTALAYLFAVFRSRPSPFYVLDEVEAALDDVNLHRFLDLVQEFRREAQLLIVTHQQRTMEIADVLYGVTMAPGEASGVVSERVGAPAG